ncbi:MAG TPA: bifunctional hydroxymethylpyrimidine kinase/phosphomethylpyrimidine kinase [Candidatus Binataceae bacterium]|jgi:hydroxymethylpyrimidine/phosphomethylpyrimidine kinase|nr:bifunctional hydroxymethylpyrimidine kinase/phosphomethylpyrimidine kinase [Candidatus Binataceae bacterium]
MSIQPVALTVAGTDPSGGAGIQADLKTFAALGVYGFSVAAVVVAQNSSRVLGTTSMEPEFVSRQIGALMMQLRPHAMKTGALGEPGIVTRVARAIEEFELPAPVVDPVMMSSSGARLLSQHGEAAMRRRLFPLAAVVTPNLPEAEALCGMPIDGAAAMREAARLIHAMGPRAVVIKGGHLGQDQDALDILYDGRSYIEFAGERIGSGGAHGTGCAFSAAITAWIARGAELEEAVRNAKAFVARALKYAFQLGEGRLLLDHLRAGDD